MIATFFIKHCFGIAKISITFPIFAAIHQIKVAEKDPRVCHCPNQQ